MFFLKKKISKIMRLAGALMVPAMLLASCSADLDTPSNGESGPKPGYITISLRDKAPGTRATEDDVDALNENLISNALVCLYTAGSDDNAAPVLSREFDLNVNTTGTVEIRLSREILTALFPGGNTCRAYVVANLPEGSAIPAESERTINNLKDIAVEADFATYDPQPSFVMDGGNTLTLTGDIATPSQCEVTGNVDLQRAASKIRLGVKVAESVTANGETWEPQIENGMNVLITNGVRKAKVTPDAKPGSGIADPYYSTATNAEDETHRGRTLTDKGEGVEYRYQLDESFYSYPNSWSGNDETMTYMVLTVPFKKVGAETYRTCYYTVPVVRDNAIVRNVSYMVNINIEILGSFNPDVPLVLEDLSYKAIDWSQESMNVNIQDYRYLVLDQTEYVVNNLSEISIPFYSSHETVVKSVSFKYYLYNTSAAGLVKEVSVSKEQNEASENGKGIYQTDVDNTINSQTNARTLTFTHELKEMTAYNSGGRVLQLSGSGTTYPSESTINSNIAAIARYALTDVDAYSRFDIEITIVHKDLENNASTPFQRTIKITQYPAMYIEADENKFITNHYNDSEPYGVAAYANVYINGNNGADGSGSMRPSGLSGGNRNPNMYIINVTRLSSNRYRIGDPRVTTVDNLIDNSSDWGETSWTEAPALFGTSQRRLMYYYPTDTSDAMKMTIAPKFRVASSYGVSPTMDKETAQRRCASYQEQGYPAGRWRLPTYAEMEYIITLSNNNRIPVLFSSSSRYWNASGSSRATITNGALSNPGNNDANVRCVYDEWYWESIEPKMPSSGTSSCEMRTGWNQYTTFTIDPYYKFTWGDKQR